MDLKMPEFIFTFSRENCGLLLCEERREKMGQCWMAWGAQGDGEGSCGQELGNNCLEGSRQEFMV